MPSGAPRILAPLEKGRIRVWLVNLSAGGEPGQCGWLKDRFGVSWQIVPTILPELMQTGDAVKTTMLQSAPLELKGSQSNQEQKKPAAVLQRTAMLQSTLVNAGTPQL